LPHWAARWVPESLGLQPGQAALLNDDRLGRALDHLQRADRASLLTALVQHSWARSPSTWSEFHQDTTTVTFSGEYGTQPDATRADRPPRITFGYNKDHRPDLKQLLYSITISADGAVPLHCKLYDGNTTDDAVHIDTWLFLRQLVGHSDFLYVADSKLCSRDNMSFIASRQGRFLTVMPRTRSEDVGSATMSRRTIWSGGKSIANHTPGGRTAPTWSTMRWKVRSVPAKAIGCCGIAVRRRRNWIVKVAGSACSGPSAGGGFVRSWPKSGLWQCGRRAAGGRAGRERGTGRALVAHRG
jgi:Transposase